MPIWIDAAVLRDLTSPAVCLGKSSPFQIDNGFQDILLALISYNTHALAFALWLSGHARVTIVNLQGVAVSWACLPCKKQVQSCKPHLQFAGASSENIALAPLSVLKAMLALQSATSADHVRQLHRYRMHHACMHGR